MNSRIPRVTQEQNVLEYIFFPDSKVFVFIFFFMKKKISTLYLLMLTRTSLINSINSHKAWKMIL